MFTTPAQRHLQNNKLKILITQLVNRDGNVLKPDVLLANTILSQKKRYLNNVNISNNFKWKDNNNFY